MEFGLKMTAPLAKPIGGGQAVLPANNQPSHPMTEDGQEASDAPRYNLHQAKLYFCPALSHHRNGRQDGQKDSQRDHLH